MPGEAGESPGEKTERDGEVEEDRGVKESVIPDSHLRMMEHCVLWEHLELEDVCYVFRKASLLMICHNNSVIPGSSILLVNRLCFFKMELNLNVLQCEAAEDKNISFQSSYYFFTLKKYFYILGNKYYYLLMSRMVPLSCVFVEYRPGIWMWLA